MTADDPALSPTEEAAVRARLAEARHTDPVPDHVVARLDAVLADLTAERTAKPSAEPSADRREPVDAPVAPVVPLASRRRRALAAGLVAAAAVVALGVALPQVLDSTGGSDSASSGSAADSGGSVAEAGPGQGDDAGDDAAAGSAPSELAEGDGAASSERAGSAFAAPLALRSDEALRPAVRPLARQGAVTAYDASPGCVLDVGDGDRVDATWDGLPAVVVLRPVEEDRQDVEVFVCGSDEVVASTTLRAP
ncbi:hypothetical protein ASG88_09715 [Nocardioides sp. Soil777]|uniref:hypothetical protein n=1 Tax=Nocardioides sp. Soil777 TaxID=1736409 RepID=UPI0007145DA1|nr:hypothetical protein [Nocardioides sp. Soil777]KRF00717.1 hypothetical protein ASG88_09715 [Nocardioides sp. Soil777]